MSTLTRYHAYRKNRKTLLTLTLTLLLLAGTPLFALQTFVQGATTIFTDNFETGDFSKWTGTKSHDGGVSAGIQTGTVYSGTYSTRFVVADQAYESGYCLYKDLGATYTTINARTYVYLTATPKVGSVMEVMGFSSDGWIPNAVGTRIDIVNVGGNAQWRVNYYSGGWQSGYVGSVQAGNWYCIETHLVIGSGNGETRFYVNDTEVLTKTGLSNTAAGAWVRYLSLGINDETGGNTLNVFYDSVAVADSYIGPEGSPSPTPTPTPTASPTPSPSPSPSPTPTPTPSPTPTPTPSPFSNSNPYTNAFSITNSFTHTNSITLTNPNTHSIANTYTHPNITFQRHLRNRQHQPMDRNQNLQHRHNPNNTNHNHLQRHLRPKTRHSRRSPRNRLVPIQRPRRIIHCHRRKSIRTINR